MASYSYTMNVQDPTIENKINIKHETAVYVFFSSKCMDTSTYIFVQRRILTGSGKTYGHHYYFPRSYNWSQNNQY